VEARGRDGRQVTAMIRGRGANFLFGSARVSTSSDAYDLASAFGDDFTTMLITGKSPFGTMPRAPSLERVQALAGGSLKYAAGEAFGRELVLGMIGGAIVSSQNGTTRGILTVLPRPNKHQRTSNKRMIASAIPLSWLSVQSNPVRKLRYAHKLSS
jgi:hypothetical protein